jgi:tetratricopeptide (TPR) repeat protein
MTSPLHRSYCIAFTVGSLCGVLMTSGCQFFGGSIWEKHFSNTRQADAKRHWNEMRGDIQLQLAENHFDAGRFDESEKVLEQAISLSPDNARVFVLATKLHLEKGDLSKARAAVRRAESLPGDSAEVQYLAGIVAERYGDRDMALEHYSSAAMQDPQMAAYVLAQAETLVSLDKPIEAMELIEARLQDFDGNAPMRMLAAHLNQRLGLRGPAVEYAREALRIMENDSSLAGEVGRMLVWAGQYEEAIAVLRPVLETASAAGGSSGPMKVDGTSPVSPSMLRDLAHAYMAMRQWREAQWVLKPIMARDEADVAGWCMYAQAALMSGDLEAAWETIRTLHESAPPTPESLLLSSHIALRRGDFSGALDGATRAVQMDGKLASAYCLMGRAYDGLGRGEEASQAYAKAVALDPEMVAAGLRLSELQGRGGMTAGLHEQGQVKGPVQDQRDTTAGVLVGGEP